MNVGMSVYRKHRGCLIVLATNMSITPWYQIWTALKVRWIDFDWLLNFALWKQVPFEMPFSLIDFIHTEQSSGKSEWNVIPFWEDSIFLLLMRYSGWWTTIGLPFLPKVSVPPNQNSVFDSNFFLQYQMFEMKSTGF